MHVSPIGLPFLVPNRTTIVIGLKREQITDGTVMQSTHQFLKAIRMAKAKPGNDRKLFLLRKLTGSKHGPNARTVHSHWLFRKDMDARVDSFLYVNGTEVRGRGQKDNVHSTREQLIEGIETNEPLSRRN